MLRREGLLLEELMRLLLGLLLLRRVGLLLLLRRERLLLSPLRRGLLQHQLLQLLIVLGLDRGLGLVLGRLRCFCRAAGALPWSAAAGPGAPGDGVQRGVHDSREAARHDPGAGGGLVLGPPEALEVLPGWARLATNAPWATARRAQSAPCHMKAERAERQHVAVTR